MQFSKYKNSEECLVYKYNFSNLADLYDYLVSDPYINTSIFTRLSSEQNDSDFAGDPLPVAIDYLKSGYDIDFEKFDIATKDIRKNGFEDINSRKLERSLHGGMYLSPLVAAGVPDCMIRYTQDFDPKHITVYFQLAYSGFTSREQIFNRGVATINLIQSLEDKGYIVDLKVFELSFCYDEWIDVEVDLKATDELLNISKCYYPFVSKEFLRRLLFRVLETTPVKNRNWGYGYGRTATLDEIRSFYKLKSRDLVITAPTEIGIEGDNIYEDIITLFNYLNLDNEFDLSKMKEKAKSKVKQLRY